ncbi:insulin-like growth factor-binding protein 2-B [Haplochromis burtoni]|uniref:Insulin-like growth factor binding protein 2b n=1 Tax=Haplochromis burtoni TaxID=8153 RepID=A0A3Q2W3I8_HAPBU|nr:insulin-like growth factor-binding protein 2-B [Haplochromis burtoni]
MGMYFLYGLLFAYVGLPGLLLCDLAFRCPSCTAEDMMACTKVDPLCAEIVREPGCGCCPVCARQVGELCGVYLPRCSTGLRCYPSMDADFPLQQLIQGLGQCGQRIDVDVWEHLNPSGYEVHGTENPLTGRPPLNPWIWQKTALEQYLQDRRTRMKINQRVSQSACQQELDRVLEEIAKMPSEDNRGPLENLYELKFPNCDKHGLYNLKQCNMSTHGQRGECWCVDPLTGVQISETPKVRGDPNCNQFQEVHRAMPTAEASH